MIYRRKRRLLPLILIGFSATLHLTCITLYSRLPDAFAAFTAFPIWTWGLLGLLLSSSAFLLFRTRLSLFLTTIWFTTILLASDEAQVLGRLNTQAPEKGKPKPFQGEPTIRVVTLNCHLLSQIDKHLLDYHPDIIFLQEIPHAYRLKKLTDTLYDGRGDYRYDNLKRCAIIVRGTLKDEIKVPKFRTQHMTAKLHNGRHIQLVNVHLQPAATNLRLWQRNCWHTHRNNRQRRRVELTYALGILSEKTKYPTYPALIAGDFNAPANDSIYHLLDHSFVDAFDAAGTGWGNTFHRALPLLRIDHIYSSPQFIPKRCRAISLPDSDHRLLIADYILTR